MIRGIIRFLIQLLVLAFLALAMTAAWIIWDGLNDVGQYGDVAVVPGQAESDADGLLPVVQARLDRAAELYKANRFTSIVVAGRSNPQGKNEAQLMAGYLKDHEVPENAIILDYIEERGQGEAGNLSAIMKQHTFHSAVIVDTYYRITRLKMIYRHAGITDIQQAHSGKLQQGDIAPITVEIIAYYNDLLNFYVVPAAQKAVKEAKTGSEKVQEGADSARKSVEKGLDNLPK